MSRSHRPTPLACLALAAFVAACSDPVASDALDAVTADAEVSIPGELDTDPDGPDADAPDADAPDADASDADASDADAADPDVLDADPDAPDPDPSDAPTCGDTRLVPPSVALSATDLAVPIDVLALEAKVHLDLGTGTASVVATLTFRTSEEGGFPVFDLRQSVSSLTLDGEALPVDALERHDFALAPSGGVLVLRSALGPCSLHHLVLAYTLGPARPYLRWEPDAVTWSIGLNDVVPGMLLERWFPAPLLHDTFAFHLSVDLAGPATDHLLLANAPVSHHTPGSHWEVAFPDDTDVMSSFFYLAPRRDMTLVEGPGFLIAASRGLPTTIPFDLLEPALVETLADFTRRFGPRPAPGLPFLVVFDLMTTSGGMEYRNAAQLSVKDRDTLRHEVAHTWFGRSLSPARHLDGWVDETLATWTTTTNVLDLVALAARGEAPGPRASLDPWLRATYDQRTEDPWPYVIGPAVLDAIATGVGRDLLTATLEDWARDCRGHHITQDDFREVLLTLPAPAFIDALLSTWLIPPHEPPVHGTCPRHAP